MRKGFQKVTLGAVAATLLSGSVFATGPTIDGIPSVVITDRVSSPTANPPGNVYDVNTNETLNIYRFTDALVIEDYVTFDQSKSLVNFLFTEADSDGTIRTGGARALEIGIGEPPVYRLGEAATPLASDINTLGTDVVNAGALDFRNIARTSNFATGTTGTLSTFTDEALVTIFVSDATSGEVDFDSFTVITTNDPVYDFDSLELSSASGIFTPVVCYDNFDSWYALSLNSFIRPGTQPTLGWLASTDSADFFADATSVPSFSANASPADVLRVTTPGNPTGGGSDIAGFGATVGFWQSFQPSSDGTVGGRPADTTVAVTADTLYMIRWTYSTGATVGNRTTQEPIRFRINSTPEATALNGNITDEYNAGANWPVGTGIQQRSWFYAAVDGSISMNLDSVDLATTDPGHDLRLDQVEVFSTTRAQLGTGTVLYNAGTANGSLTLGTIGGNAVPAPPTDGYAAFNVAANWGGAIVNDLGTSNGRLYTSTGTSGSQLVATLNASPNTGNQIGTWLSNGPDADTGLLSAVPGNGKLLALDVYYTSPEGATANNDLPDGRVGLNGLFKGETGQSGGLSQGRSAFFSWATHNKTNVGLDIGGTFASYPLASTTAAKRVTLFMEPQTQVASTVDLDIYLQSLAFDSLFDSGGTQLLNPTDRGTTNWVRVVVTSYDVPSDAATVAVGTCN